MNGRRQQEKRTRIVATIGPASSGEQVLRSMIEAGLDVVRINFSHAERQATKDVVQKVRQLSEELRIPVAIMGDLRGPRIRVGALQEGRVHLSEGERLALTPEKILGTSRRISVSFAALARDLEPGALLVLDDGDLELRVEEIDQGSGEIHCRITRGGPLSSNRGINLPGRQVSLPAVTAKDYEDIDFALEQGFDFLALSFVQSGQDVIELKDHLAGKGSNIPIISKIEKQGALENLEAIVRESYGIMVARGDLALEMSLQDVPIAQKRIIEFCREANKPVITATQMLESMTHTHKPTRAEAADVANAILDGTDAVMLSGESAIGKFPVQAVAMMSAIARRVETAWFKRELPGPPSLAHSDQMEAAVGDAGQLLVKSLGAKALVAYTTSGATACRVACHRPSVPLLALCSDPVVERRLCLTWGVRTVLVERVEGTAHLVEMSIRETIRCIEAQPGDVMVITAGTPYEVSGPTNLIKIEKIPEPS